MPCASFDVIALLSTFRSKWRYILLLGEEMFKVTVYLAKTEIGQLDSGPFGETG